MKGTSMYYLYFSAFFQLCGFLIFALSAAGIGLYNNHGLSAVKQMADILIVILILCLIQLVLCLAQVYLAKRSGASNYDIEQQVMPLTQFQSVTAILNSCNQLSLQKCVYHFSISIFLYSSWRCPEISKQINIFFPKKQREECWIGGLTCWTIGGRGWQGGQGEQGLREDGSRRQPDRSSGKVDQELRPIQRFSKGFVQKRG